MYADNIAFRGHDHSQEAMHKLIEPIMSISEASLLCFKKGSYIELSSGLIRRIEDLRTEDFIQSARCSRDFQLMESTVVKITEIDAQNVITFSYDSNRSRVQLQVSLAYPLFVYGQGWASCNPLQTFAVYELKCKQLQVGDICITLMKRATPEDACALNAFNDFNCHRKMLLLNAINTKFCGNYIDKMNTTAVQATNYSYQIYAEMSNMMMATYTASCAQQMFNTLNKH